MKKKRYIDFFCGAGGATQGLKDSDKVEVVCAINHDPDALEAHKANHPEVHHINHDIRDIDPVELASQYPDIDGIWWSAECTHLSLAAGGRPRKADSRMLSCELYGFVAALDPDHILVENVKEFLSWGPLRQKKDEYGKLLFYTDKEGIEQPHMAPDPDRKGEFYFNWVRTICEMGYNYEYRILNSANYGARQKRSRYFGVFVKTPLVPRWPRQTHTKNPDKGGGGLFCNNLKKWLPVRDILDLDNHGESIFTREERGLKPLVKRTIERIEYGLNKFASNGDNQFILMYSYNNKARSLDGPMPTVMAKRDTYLCTCEVKQDVRSCEMILKYYGTDNKAYTLDDPLHTITTKDRFSVVKCQYITHQYGGKENNQSIDKPLNTITVKPKGSLVTFIEKANGGKDGGVYNVCSIDGPLHTVTCKPTLRLINGLLVDNRIIDIKMRMLTKEELLAAQGFPIDYKMPRGETKAKKMIGNAVECTTAMVLTLAQYGTEEERVTGLPELVSSNQIIKYHE